MRRIGRIDEVLSGLGLSFERLLAEVIPDELESYSMVLIQEFQVSVKINGDDDFERRCAAVVGYLAEEPLPDGAGTVMMVTERTVAPERRFRIVLGPDGIYRIAEWRGHDFVPAEP